MPHQVEARRLIEDYFAVALDVAEREPGASAAAHAERVRQAWRAWSADGTLDPATAIGLRAWVTNRALAAPAWRRTGALAERDAVLDWLTGREDGGGRV